MLANWDPFNEFARLQSQLFAPRSNGHAPQDFRLSVDIYEDANGVHIKADLPGIKKEDLKLEIENRVLTIRGERKVEKVDEGTDYRRVERSYGSFTRSFALTGEVDPEEVKADYKDGVLTVTVPKKPTAARREISVSTQ